MNRAMLLVMAMLVALDFPGCFGYPASHDIFSNQSNYWVGKSILDLRINSGPSRGVNKISNGNMEEEWIWYHRCRKFFEYDPRTNIIVSWRFEGSKTDCVSVAP